MPLSSLSLLFISLGTLSGGDIVLHSNIECISRPVPIFQAFSLPSEDTRIDTFVSREIPLNDKNYIPDDLVSISGSVNIDEAGRKVYLRRIARDALWKMAEDFYKEFGKPLVVISGYRGFSYQKYLWDTGKCTPDLCAPPGYSEHQLGLAIDLFDATTASEYSSNPIYSRYIAWLKDNAHRYGWHQSYQKGECIDGYDIEPWHWRYLGIELATTLKQLDMSYTEYIRFCGIIKFLMGNIISVSGVCSDL